MGITTSLSNDNTTVTLAISGNFNAEMQREFREAYSEYAKEHSNLSYVLDLSKTEYMDSSALGMLLLLKESVGDDKSRVTIRGANDFIKDILEITNFGDLFTIA
ncbi:MAG: STAS domain-containing protein [Gammaproteobacteria bacterium]|nr:STAS domain-containing protein [Gammaproteobacteria bacterium]